MRVARHAGGAAAHSSSSCKHACTHASRAEREIRVTMMITIWPSDGCSRDLRRAARPAINPMLIDVPAAEDQRVTRSSGVSRTIVSQHTRGPVLSDVVFPNPMAIFFSIHTSLRKCQTERQTLQVRALLQHGYWIRTTTLTSSMMQRSAIARRSLNARNESSSSSSGGSRGKIAPRARISARAGRDNEARARTLSRGQNPAHGRNMQSSNSRTSGKHNISVRCRRVHGKCHAITRWCASTRARGIFTFSLQLMQDHRSEADRITSSAASSTTHAIAACCKLRFPKRK
ncbi:unnamed protein product [Trichogramma brassicae]|uniref:Uncharacterized protein n=1 Tax=Trichogramma brassicae TaxID=86971 RepID=A0A6H5HVH4_9HYME|nr:unnamed protein product [Trichogramma brassicae]